MMQTDAVLKVLYRSDSVDKNLILDFFHPSEKEAFLSLGGADVLSETMELDESLSSSENLDFGACEASQVKLTLLEKPEAIKDSEMSLYQTLDGLFPAPDLYPAEELFPSGYTMPLGRYVVQSVEQQANQNYWDLTALDYMSKFDTNVIDWYNGLTFPMPLRDFRASLCWHVGVTEEVPSYLPNDGMLVEKTIDTAELLGRTVLVACEQANGVFGHFDRTGVLQHIALQPNDCLAPAPDLYPADDLYPVLPGSINTQVYDERISPALLITCQFGEHTVKSIDTVHIRQEEGDIGAIYGAGTNCYTVEGNFLLYGKDADELAVIARNIYGMISGRVYRPYESYGKGLPYLEVGDALELEFGEESIVSYMIKRTLKGVYALKDSYSATGDEVRGTESNVNTEIIQLKGKSAILKKSVDEVSATVTDLGERTEAQFKITAQQIESTVTRLGEAESLIKQTADRIDLKVSKGDVSAQLSIESGGITIKGNRFSVEATNLTITPDGTLTCKNGHFTGEITATSGKIGGFDINGNTLTAASDNTEIRFGDYYMNRSGCNFKNVEIDEQGIYIGSIGQDYTHIWESDTGTIYVNEVYIDQSWWDGWSVTETVKSLWNYVHGGGWDPCGDDCDDCGDCDSCDDLEEDSGCGCNL